MKKIVIDNMVIEVEKKNIKNIYLRVSHENHSVKVTAPFDIEDEYIRRFVYKKASWIKKNLDKRQLKDSSESMYFYNSEEIFIWGERYLVEERVTEEDYRVVMEKNKVVLFLKEECTQEKKEHIIKQWYRELLIQAIDENKAECENITGRNAKEWRIKNMKTRWGSCNIKEKRIWINLQLAKKSPECLKYVMIHELTHLRVRNHNRKFWEYMDQFYPQWRTVRKIMNGR